MAVRATERLMEASARLVVATWATRKIRHLATLEGNLERYMMRAFYQMELVFYENMPEKPPLVEADPAWEAADWIDGLPFEFQLNRATFDAFAARAMLLGMRDTVGDIGGLPAAFRLPNPRATAYLAEYGATLVRNISTETRTQLRDVLFRSRAQGWSYDTLAQALKDKWAQFRVPQPQQHIRSRAHLIAVTETASAYEAGNNEVRAGLEAEGWTMEKAWLMVGDDRTCMICAGNASVGFLANSASFPSGHRSPPGHPACRCTAVPRVAEETIQ